MAIHVNLWQDMLIRGNKCKNMAIHGNTWLYSRLPITQTLANSNQNQFPLDFRHTFTVILPSVTRTPANSNQFSFPLRSFSI